MMFDVAECQLAVSVGQQPFKEEPLDIQSNLSSIYARSLHTINDSRDREFFCIQSI
jgi:hypothetical protein